MSTDFAGADTEPKGAAKDRHFIIDGGRLGSLF